MSLLQICQNALREIGTYEVPASIISNNNETALQILATAQNVGKYLTRRYDLTDLVETHTFNTADGTASYALPTGFRKFSNLTFWDETNDWELLGPVSRAEWQRLQSSNITATSRSYFRIAGKLFYIFPTPTSVEAITYQYLSDYWCESSVGTGQNAWAADTDVGVLDEYLMERHVVWRFLKSKGLPYEEEKAEADEITSSHLANDGAAAAITMDRESFGVIGHNFPEQDYGA